MRTFLKSLSLSIWAGIALTFGGVAAYHIGSYLDNGNISRLTAAHQPIYMNTTPEAVMMFGWFIAALGLLHLFGASCDRAGLPATGDALGIFLGNPIKKR